MRGSFLEFGSAAAALDLGALAVLACLTLLWLFQHVVARRARPV